MHEDEVIKMNFMQRFKEVTEATSYLSIGRMLQSFVQNLPDAVCSVCGNIEAQKLTNLHFSTLTIKLSN